MAESRDVLISIRPHWVHKILSGEKLVEVRKTVPIQPTPYRCFIYVTVPTGIQKRNGVVEYHDELYRMPDGSIHFGSSKDVGDCEVLTRKIIGSFLCNRVCFYSTQAELHRLIRFSCLSMDNLTRYKANHKGLYGMYISSIEVFDQPFVLSDLGLNHAPQNWRYMPDIAIY